MMSVLSILCRLYRIIIAGGLAGGPSLGMTVYRQGNTATDITGKLEKYHTLTQ